MQINTEHLDNCIAALEYAAKKINKIDKDKEKLEYDILRASCVKEFEIILEQSGKLLKKKLKPFFATAASVDRLVFKDIFRSANLHGLLNIEETERWLEYRDSRNTVAHDYGEEFADEILKFLPSFINDAKNISKVFKEAQ